MLNESGFPAGDKFIWAIDFDGTMVKSEYPKIGMLKDGFLKVYRDFVLPNPIHTVLWTCRDGKILQEAINFCKSMGIRIDSVNKLPQGMTFTTSPKIFYNHLTDDLAGFTGSWPQEYQLLMKKLNAWKDYRGGN